MLDHLVKREDSAERWAKCKAVPVSVKEKLNSRNGYAETIRRRGKMLLDVVMVQM